MTSPRILSIVFLASTVACFADDKPASGPTLQPVYTPALPLSEAQIEAIVDRAVIKAMTQHPTSPSPQFANATQASPQAATSAPQTVHVLVPAGPFAKRVAKFGQRLASLGEPKTKAMTLASSPANAAFMPAQPSKQTP